ncbi:hypothetical protein LSH36_222g04005 [Paralvinella palmiformis]|uniref:Peptidase M14 domain-containing protein n=1 Tax=Paralvinella palmiformis TaxID=53620 RepID=A0AAD9JMR3_9ANNE|nr:hypothetical protein LSH36_222g04005 [Paralvinella palmiformis]
MKSFYLLFLIVNTVITTDFSSNYKTYEGYKVLEVVPSTTEQVRAIEGLRRDNEIDFWTLTRKPGLPTRFMLPPNKISRTTDYLKNYGIDIRIINHNVGIQVARERQRLRSREASGMAFDLDDFNTYEDISSGMANGAYWIDSLIHAREWLTGATILKIIDHFITNYGTDQEVTDLVNKYDWHFLPVINPDGYIYSWETDRYWRKSRNINEGSDCIGTDLNRNFDSHWSLDGTEPDPCSINYHGTGPASEPEIEVMQNELLRLGPTLTGSVAMHTPAWMWLHSWGFTEDGSCARPIDYDTLLSIARETVHAIEDTYNSDWTYGTICDIFYPASGTACDFCKEKASIVYSFTPELRGPDHYVDPSEIDPSFQEIYNGLKTMITEIEALP